MFRARVHTSEEIAHEILLYEETAVSFQPHQLFIRRYSEFWPTPLEGSADTAARLDTRIRLFVMMNKVRL